MIWKSDGLNALLDPQLASRLHLSRAQQEDVRILLYDRLVLPTEARVELARAAAILKKIPDGDAQARQMAETLKIRMGELDATIWDVLSTTQARELARILGQPMVPARRQAPKAKKSIRPS
jgi:hypothetical protein